MPKAPNRRLAGGRARRPRVRRATPTSGGPPPGQAPDASGNARTRLIAPRSAARGRGRPRDAHPPDAIGPPAGPAAEPHDPAPRQTGVSWKRVQRASTRDCPGTGPGGRGAGRAGRRRPAARRAECRTIHRRRFLLGTVAGLGGVGAAVVAADLASGSDSGGRQKVPARRPDAPSSPPPRSSRDTLASGVVVPTAQWLIEENAQPGTIDWVVTGIQTPHAIEGYASQVSAVAGRRRDRSSSTRRRRAFHVEAYRMGYYQGLGGRLDLADRHAWPATPAAAAHVDPRGEHGRVPVEPDASRSRSTKAWPPGQLPAQAGGRRRAEQQYVPLCVRDDASTAAFVLQNSVTTWQAYNLWGGYSLYYGATSSGGSDFADRSRVVSFDRPYPQTWAQGSADFFGNEFPLLYQMEQPRARHDLLDRCRPARRAPSCWPTTAACSAWVTTSTGRRPCAAAPSRPSRGARTSPFSGPTPATARSGWRTRRWGPTAGRSATRTPPRTPSPASTTPLITVNWESPPVSQPESTLIGSMYQSVGANADLVVTDGSHWLFDGCDLQRRTAPHPRGPGRVRPLRPRHCRAARPTSTCWPTRRCTNQGTNWSDITYYTRQGGGGVLALGIGLLRRTSSPTRRPSRPTSSRPPSPG